MSTGLELSPVAVAIRSAGHVDAGTEQARSCDRAAVDDGNVACKGNKAVGPVAESRDRPAVHETDRARGALRLGIDAGGESGGRRDGPAVHDRDGAVGGP